MEQYKIRRKHMSRICAITGKSANFGNSRSHSNIATRRKQKVNLQTISLNGRRVRVAASTLRTLHKMTAIANGTLPSKMQKKATKQAARKVAAAAKK
jgi:ribosomal protein L28